MPKEERIRLLRANSAMNYWTGMLMDNFRASRYLVGSSIWISEDAEPDLLFLKEHVRSDIFRIDFADEKAPAQQTEWINKWTNNFIKEQVKTEDFKDTSTPMAALVCRLIGTTYMKDSWEKEFFSEPKEGIFHTESGKEQKVPFLHSGDINTVYQKQLDYEMLKIPMTEGNFVVILPSKGVAINDLLKKDVLEEASRDQNWNNVEAKVIIPDFGSLFPKHRRG